MGEHHEYECPMLPGNLKMLVCCHGDEVTDQTFKNLLDFLRAKFCTKHKLTIVYFDANFNITKAPIILRDSAIDDYAKDGGPGEV